jgi:hypothetical protein
MALAAEHDLCGPLLDLVTAVLAIGGEVSEPSGGGASGPGLRGWE